MHTMNFLYGYFNGNNTSVKLTYRVILQSFSIFLRYKQLSVQDVYLSECYGLVLEQIIKQQSRTNFRSSTLIPTTNFFKNNLSFF